MGQNDSTQMSMNQPLNLETTGLRVRALLALMAPFSLFSLSPWRKASCPFTAGGLSAETVPKSPQRRATDGMRSAILFMTTACYHPGEGKVQLEGGVQRSGLGIR